MTLDDRDPRVLAVLLSSPHSSTASDRIRLTNEMPRQRRNAPGPTQEVSAPVQTQPNEPWHGKLNGYDYHRCRCDACRAAKSYWNKKYRVLKPKLSIRERFWAKVAKTDGCWLWTGSRNPEGYGNFWVRDRIVRATHIAWELEHGVAPLEGFFVCHHCDNPSCVNPAHLFVGTQSDNMRDGYSKGRMLSQNHPERMARGARQWCAKLTPEIVREIRRRRAAGETIAALAREYGVGRRTLQDVVHRRTWTWLDEEAA